MVKTEHSPSRFWAIFSFAAFCPSPPDSESCVLIRKQYRCRLARRICPARQVAALYPLADLGRTSLPLIKRQAMVSSFWRAESVPQDRSAEGAPSYPLADRSLPMIGRQAMLRSRCGRGSALAAARALQGAWPGRPASAKHTAKPDVRLQSGERRRRGGNGSQRPNVESVHPHNAGPLYAPVCTASEEMHLKSEEIQSIRIAMTLRLKVSSL